MLLVQGHELGILQVGHDPLEVRLGVQVTRRHVDLWNLEVPVKRYEVFRVEFAKELAKFYWVHSRLFAVRIRLNVGHQF